MPAFGSMSLRDVDIALSHNADRMPSQPAPNPADAVVDRSGDRRGAMYRVSARYIARSPRAYFVLYQPATKLVVDPTPIETVIRCVIFPLHHVGASMFHRNYNSK